MRIIICLLGIVVILIIAAIIFSRDSFCPGGYGQFSSCLTPRLKRCRIFPFTTECNNRIENKGTFRYADGSLGTYVNLSDAGYFRN